MTYKWTFWAERGEFSGSVEDEDGNSIFSIDGADDMQAMIEDGFMRHTSDIKGLRDYLLSHGIIGEGDRLIGSKDSFPRRRGLSGAGKGSPHSASPVAAEPVATTTKGAYYIAPSKGAPMTHRSDSLPYDPGIRLQFTGRWRQLFNTPSRGFSMMMYGMAKQGKSTLSADFAGYLASEFGKVLYASIEEGFDPAFVERISKLRVEHRRMDVKNHLPRELTGYDFVFVDSASSGGITIQRMRELLRDWPKISWVFVFHTDKRGLPRGSNEFQHEVDVIVQVADGFARAVGRYGPGQMDVRFN